MRTVPGAPLSIYLFTPNSGFNCSNNTNWMVVVGANLAHTGINPEYRARIPSFLTTFTTQSTNPLYSLSEPTP